MRGEIDRERYLAGMSSLVTAIRENPKLAPVAAALNEDRLMLREVGAPPAPQLTLPQTSAPIPVSAPAPQPTMIAQEGGGS